MPQKLANVRLELKVLEETWSASPYAEADIAADVNALLQVNERLWVIEDDIRDKERAQAFDARIHPPREGRLRRERRAGRHQAAHQLEARFDHRRGKILRRL